MSPQPRVLLLLDPRPGASPADRITLPDGRSLLDLVGERAAVEAEPSGTGAGTVPGTSAGAARGAAGLADALAAGAPTPWCVLDGAALALPTTYGDLVADPRAEAAVLRDGNRAVGVRLDGPAALAPGTRDLVARALRGAPPGAALTVLAESLGASLAASGASVRELRAAPFPLSVVGDQAGLSVALAAEAGVDEAALRLRRSSRADDGFLSTFLVRPVSRRVTPQAVRWGWRPDAITVGSAVLGLLAAAAYAGGGLGWRVLGSVLLLASLVVDCVDGEVARYTRTFSPLGGWLDVGSDRLKEYAVYAGLAWGASSRVWGLAIAAFAVLVVRHFVDFGYAATLSGVSGDGVEAGGDPVAALSARTSARPALLWAKRAVVMPVGERTIALAVLAPIVGARWTLGVLLVAGCVSAAYTTAGRLGRRLTQRTAQRTPSVGDARLVAQLDAGRLGRRLPAPSGRWAWLLPALARTVEQGGLALLVGLVRPGALPAAYLLVAAVALHQYDVVYRQRLAGAVDDPGWLSVAGWPVRVAVVGLAVVALPTHLLAVVLLVVGIGLGLAAAADSVVWWRGFVRSGGGVQRARRTVEGSAP